MNFESLKYNELRKELKKRNLNAKGKKADLLRRLLDHEKKAGATTTTTKADDVKKKAVAKTSPKRKVPETTKNDAPTKTTTTTTTTTTTNNNNNNNNNNNAPIHTSKTNSAKRKLPATTSPPPPAKRPTKPSRTPLPPTLSGKASRYWQCHTATVFDPTVVESVYESNLRDPASIALAEFSQYLERYLWPHFDPVEASKAHVLSVAVMLNQKARLRLPVWSCVCAPSNGIAASSSFAAFFRRLLDLYLKKSDGVASSSSLDPRERVLFVRFLVVCFNSLEHPIVRKCVLPETHLRLWLHLSQPRLAFELDEVAPALRRHYDAVALEAKGQQDRLLLPRLVRDTLATLREASTSSPPSSFSTVFLARVFELLIDLLSQLPTRRFLRTLLDDMHFYAKCRAALATSTTPLALLHDLLDRLSGVHDFPVDDHTGEALTDAETEARHYARVARMQQRVYAALSDQDSRLAPLRPLCLSHIAGISSADSLRAHLATLDSAGLHQLADLLRLPRDDHVVDAVIRRFERRPSKMERINAHSLYPDDEHFRELPDDKNESRKNGFSSDVVRSLPKLNLQFLTIQDYLMRNFRLVRLEAAYEIREDVRRAVKHLKPRLDESGRTRFAGWARMAVPLKPGAFRLVEVRPPALGSRLPSAVRGEVSLGRLDQRFQGDILEEWSSLREHDVIFLLTARGEEEEEEEGGGGGKRRRREGKSADDRNGRQRRRRRPPAAPSATTTVRGATVLNILTDPDTHVTTLYLDLDPARYQADEGDVYESFNALLRRKPKENNFKAVLSTIRDLMNDESASVPRWLRDGFLGYGDPAAAAYYSDNPHLPSQLLRLDMRDTFLSAEHVEASFPTVRWVMDGGKKVSSPSDARRPSPPYELRWKQNDIIEVSTASSSAAAASTTHDPLRPRRFNRVRFTPRQIEAIRSGMNPGLTLVVGPPGTGKTDVAVQIVSNLYANFPQQRILLVAHSNQALNDLFEKIAERNVDPRHLLRLGRGSEQLETLTSQDFSRQGRVETTLQRRLDLLARVKRLAESMGLPNADDLAYTCETASHFETEIKARVARFRRDVERRRREAAGGDGTSPSVVADAFPFARFFEEEEKTATKCSTIFTGSSLDRDLAVANARFDHLFALFSELREYRAFEVLRTSRKRADYMLIRQARVVAMTCTHAAIARKRLINLDFKYDTVIVEESAQILDIETFVPMLLQRSGGRLKRVVLIGDHHQLPPVVKNRALQQYGRLDQSLFTRLVRLGAPYIALDRQGRARPSIAKLYNWRYESLGDLPCVREGSYALANSGFAYDYQFVDVGDLDGRGEIQPTAFFYQNLAEAEYVVLVFMYMRLIGYPADRVAILTTYRGQKHLIRDVLNRRCGGGGGGFDFGRPRQVATVDKFQGQQSDVVLLSLVRTEHVGHVRDVRRLVVAMSRARLGLYVFGRRALFETCYELTRTMSTLAKRPAQLALVPGECVGGGGARKSDDFAESSRFFVQDVTHMGAVVRKMLMPGA